MKFIITIDTEGDHLWSAPREITTRNARYLPRFQALAERYGFRPVYLTNYEMVECDAFVEFGRDVLERNAGEIGMHLHAWNSPPIEALTEDDFRYQPYLVEYPDEAMKAKIQWLTARLEQRFDDKMVSHRAGRWARDSRRGADRGRTSRRTTSCARRSTSPGSRPPSTGRPSLRSRAARRASSCGRGRTESARGALPA